MMKTMKTSMKCLIAMFVMTMAFAVTGITAQAATITQTAATKNSLTIQWEIPSSDTPTAYYVGISDKDSTSALEQARGKAISAGLNTSYTFNNLTPGTNYYIWVHYSYVTKSGTEYFTSVGSINNAVTLPEKVTGVKQTKWWYYLKSVDFEWDHQTAAKYEYVVKNNKGKKVHSNTTSSRKGSCSKSINNNMLYTVKVRAYVSYNNQNYYGDWSDGAYLFTQPMVNKNKSSLSSGKLKISWDKINGVTGYDVYVSTKEKTGYKKVKSVSKSKNSVTITKLKGKKINKNKKYFVYIVAKKKVGKTTYTSGKHYTYEMKNKKLNWTFDK